MGATRADAAQRAVLVRKQTTVAGVERVVRRLIRLATPLWLAPVLATSLSGNSSWQRNDVLIALVCVAVGYAWYWRNPHPACIVGALAFATFWLAIREPVVDGTLVHDLMLEQWVNLAAWCAGLVIVRARDASFTVVGIVALVAVTSMLNAFLHGAEMRWEHLIALVVYGLTDGFAAVAAFRVMRRSARATDAQIEARMQAAEGLAVQRGRQEESYRIARLMHDTVVNTLGAVKLWRDSDPAPLRERAASDLRLLQSLEARPGSTLTEVVDSCRRRAQLLGLELQVHSADAAVALPHEVAQAIEGACWEALTNVAKHSGTRQAALAVSNTEQSLLVEITDAGAGFDLPSSTLRGLNESVFARTAAAGVLATIETSPRHGTAVRLLWPRDTPGVPVTVSPQLVGALDRELAASVGWITIVLGLFGVGATARVGFGPEHSWPGLLALAAIAGVALATRRAHRTGVVWRPLCIAYVALGVVVVAAPSLGVEGCMRVGTWWWGPFAGLILGAYAAILDARRRAIACTIAGTALGYVMAVGTLIEGTDKCRQDTLAFLVLQSGLILALGAARKRHEAIHNAGAAAAATAEQIRVSLALEAARRRTREQQLAFAQSVAAPVLAGLADGSLHPAERSVRDAAGMAEETMRVLTVLPAAVDSVAGGVIADHAVAAHRKGVHLHVSFSQDTLPAASEAATLRLSLDTLLDACPPGADAQLTLLASSAGINMLAVVIADTEDNAIERLRVSGWNVTVLDRELLLERHLGATT